MGSTDWVRGDQLLAVLCHCQLGQVIPIGLYFSLYRSIFDCIGLVLVNVLASVLARIEKSIWSVFCTYHYFNTNTILVHTNTD